MTREETVKAITALTKVVVEDMGFTFDESVGVHVNWGESEDRTRGFNAGYDAADPTLSQPSTPELNAPTDEPWRSAYIDGYQSGWQCRIEHESGEYDIPEWACDECLGTGLAGSYEPVTYTQKDGTVVNGEGFVDSVCPRCNGTGIHPAQDRGEQPVGEGE